MKRCVFIHALELMLLPVDVAIIVAILVAGEIAAHRSRSR